MFLICSQRKTFSRRLPARVNGAALWAGIPGDRYDDGAPPARGLVIGAPKMDEDG